MDGFDIQLHRIAQYTPIPQEARAYLDLVRQGRYDNIATRDLCIGLISLCESLLDRIERGEEATGHQL